MSEEIRWRKGLGYRVRSEATSRRWLVIVVGNVLLSLRSSLDKVNIG